MPITCRPLPKFPLRRLLRRSLGLGLPLLAVLGWTAVSPGPGTPTPDPSLLTAAAVRQATASPSPIPPTIRLRGVVTFAHPTEPLFFVRDATGQVAVNWTDTHLSSPVSGDVVTLEGVLEPGPRVARVRALRLATDGRAPLPFAPEITFVQGLSRAMEHQWVRVRGRLVRSESIDAWQRLTLATDAGEFTASIPTTANPAYSVGTSLTIRGACNLWSAPGAKAISGFFLFSPSLDEVRPSADPVDRGAEPLTRVRQVRSLRANEAEAGQPVRLRGVVTFTHPDRRMFYLADDTGGTLVWSEREDTVLPAVGDSVAVQGVSSFDDPSPAIRADHLETLGRGALPPPRPISLGDALTGTEDGQWVEMRGHLRQVDSLGTWLRLFLTTAVGEITVSIPETAAVEAKVGSVVVVRGVCQSWKNEYNRIGGFFLFAPSAAELTVAEAPPADAFAVPEESIANLALYRPETLEMQQVRVRGTVLHHRAGHYVVVQNDSGRVRAFSQAPEPLLPGDQVEVAGMPGRLGHRNVLRGAVYRRLATGAAPTPSALPAAPKIDATMEDRLVSWQGRLTGVTTHPGETRLLLESGGAVVAAILPGDLPPAGAHELRLGSELLVTGLYCLTYDETEEPAAFSLQLRSPADLVLRQRAPWWTTRRALSALGAIGFCLVLGLAWVAVLRRQVRRQTDIIRQQMDKAAALSARHHEIVENASDLIFSTDLAGRLTSFNPAGERLTGLAPAAALQLGLGDLLVADDTTTVPTFLAQAGLPAQAPSATFETRLRTRDDHAIWVEISSRPIREAGRVSGLFGIARDITARKQMEELNRQMQKAESLSRMAAAIAHHFNNQIQAVLMGLEMVRLEIPHSPASHEILAASERSARQAAEIGALMLTYLGQAAGERTAVDLAAHCGTGLQRWRTQPRPPVELVETLPPSGPVVRANADQLLQVLFCLLANAAEAVAPQGGRIRVRLTTVGAGALPVTHRFPIDFEPRPEPYACLTVEDNGSGITEQDLGKIFDPFFTTKFHGRGTGLAIVLGIVRAHDGAVVVASQPGRGSTFHVFLPLAPTPSA